MELYVVITVLVVLVAAIGYLGVELKKEKAASSRILLTSSDVHEMNGDLIEDLQGVLKLLDEALSIAKNRVDRGKHDALIKDLGHVCEQYLIQRSLGHKLIALSDSNEPGKYASNALKILNTIKEMKHEYYEADLANCIADTKEEHQRYHSVTAANTDLYGSS